MKKVRLSQEDLPVFEQMVDFLQDYFVKCFKEDKSPTNLPLEFESVFGKDVDFYLKQKVAAVALLRMQRMFIPMELRQMYCDYLGEMTNLAQKLNLEGPLEYAILFMDLLQKGHISLNGKYNFENSNFKQESILGILPIFNNKGVCRNHAIACSDFLNFAFENDDEIAAIAAGCEIKLTNETIKQRFDRKLDEFINIPKDAKAANISLIESFVASIINLFHGYNHMFTLIKSNNEIFGLDCTNYQVVKILNSEFGQSVALPFLNTCNYRLNNNNATELYNNGNSEYFKINSLLSNGSYDISQDEDLELRFISALKKITSTENSEQYINSFCENTRKLREEMLLLASNLEIPSHFDLQLWCVYQEIGFYPENLPVEYTAKHNYVKRR